MNHGFDLERMSEYLVDDVICCTRQFIVPGLFFWR